MNNKETCDILLHNGSYLNEQMAVIPNTSIAIRDGLILDVLDSRHALNHYQPKELIDNSGLLWMPGLIDGHMHTGQQLLKGQVLDELPMIWTRIMLPFESTLNDDIMRLSSQLAALEMIRSGTTGFVDAGSYHMAAAADSYLQSGLRGALSCSTMDEKGLPRSICQTAAEAIAATDQLYEQYHGQGNLKVYYSLRSLLSCSQELIEAAFGRADERDTRIQAHMNEYPHEVNYHLSHFQMRPMEYLDSLGILSPRFISAHGLMLSEQEMDLIGRYHISVVHCPFSNCAKGIPATPALLKRGINVGIGSDGAAHGGLSLWNEMKIFRSVMNVSHGVATANPAIMPAKQILAMATRNGAALLGEENTLGIIKSGYKADLISIDLCQPHLFPSNNLPNTLLECVTGADVRDLMVNGSWLMKKRQVLTLDEEKILKEAHQYLCSN